MTAKHYILVLFIMLIVLLGFYALLEQSRDRIYMPVSVEVKEATILEMASDYSGASMKLYISSIRLSPDDSWMEVQPAFYSAHKKNDRIGVLVANYDVFRCGKEFYITGDRVKLFEKNTWQILTVYNNLEEAQKANTPTTVTMDAVMLRKKAAKDGTLYLIMDAQGKKIKTAVQNADYDKYSEGQTVKCEFEIIGDFTRFIGIKS